MFVSVSLQVSVYHCFLTLYICSPFNLPLSVWLSFPLLVLLTFFLFMFFALSPQLSVSSKLFLYLIFFLFLRLAFLFHPIIIICFLCNCHSSFFFLPASFFCSLNFDFFPLLAFHVFPGRWKGRLHIFCMYFLLPVLSP